MSRFFRQQDSSSSSSSESDDNNDRTPNPDQASSSWSPETGSQDDAAALNNTVARLTNLNIDPNTNHRDLLLHALLEERCLRQAQDDLLADPDPEQVRRKGHEHYLKLSQQLATHGMIAPGLQAAHLSQHRERYRNGLDLLSQNLRNADSSPNRQTVRGMIESSKAEQQAIKGMDVARLSSDQLAPPWTQWQQLVSPELFLDTSQSFGLLTTSNQWSLQTRYQREFEEISTLGQGGYGVVYHCRHRLDGLSYAVKKVPLSRSIMHSIQERGQEAVKELLLELTTLARLDHPNVVRYFGGWVEWTVLHSASPVESDSRDMRSTPTMQEYSGSANRFLEIGDDFISFERSESHETTTSGASQTSRPSDTLERQSTRQTHATVTDDDVESISRSSDQPELSTLSARISSMDPCLALHIQMGLYPSTLADHLGLQTNVEQRHCFHVEPSLRILLALSEGIAYLHSQGIAHRDLKPANIFMSTSSPSTILHCRQCSKAGLLQQSLKVRIGDFGLVAELAQQGMYSTSPVGTDIYRPEQSGAYARLEALDWFAFGIIMFELLWRFTTRMERHYTLSALKAGLYPPDFAQRIEDPSDGIAEMLEYLLRRSHQVHPDTVQHKLQALLNTII